MVLKPLTWLSFLNKVGVVLSCLVVLSMLIGVPSVIVSFDEAELFGKVNNSTSIDDLRMFAMNLAKFHVIAISFFYRFLGMLVFFGVIFIKNLMCVKKLKEELLHLRERMEG